MQTTPLALAFSGGLVLSVSYTQRLRFGFSTRFKILLRTSDGQPLGNASVRVESAFLDRFENISTEPPPARVSDESYEFTVAKDERESLITIQLDPEKYGRGVGRVMAATPAGVVVEVPLHVFIFP